LEKTHGGLWFRSIKVWFHHDRLVSNRSYWDVAWRKGPILCIEGGSYYASLRSNVEERWPYHLLSSGAPEKVCFVLSALLALHHSSDHSILNLLLFAFDSAFDLPLWAHNSIYGEEDTSDLLCKRDDDVELEASSKTTY
jgi:hypothetical protein